MQNATCSRDQCESASEHSIFVRNESDPPPQPGEKDKRGVRIVRFCKSHWRELMDFLPVS